MRDATTGPAAATATPADGRRWLSLAVFFVLSFAAAALGSLFPPGAWYAELTKPTWTPPGWLFGPVWTVLYATIAVSGWLLWRRSERPGARAALAAWSVQMLLNALWSWLFFGLQAPGVALGEILALWTAILATVVLAWRVRPLAGALLLPYLAWVGFAAVLNAAIWSLN